MCTIQTPATNQRHLDLLRKLAENADGEGGLEGVKRFAVHDVRNRDLEEFNIKGPPLRRSRCGCLQVL